MSGDGGDEADGEGGTVGEGGAVGVGGAVGEGGTGHGGSAGSGGAANAHAGGGAAGEAGAGGQGGEAGAAGEGGTAGHGGWGGSGGAADAGAAGEAGAGGEGGEAGGCSAGYTEVDGACRVTCAPRDFDGASIALGLGHADVIAAAYDAESGELELFVSDDSFPVRQPQAVRRMPESVLVHGKPSSIVEVPDIPALSGILVPGTNVWLLPEGQPEAEAGALVWPGFQAYGVDPGQLLDNRLIVRLLSHEGSGKFVGFANVQDEVTPPVRYFDLLEDIDELELPVGTHLHMNWVFTEGGVHRLRFELEGSTLGGATVNSDAHTYRFYFGELAELPATERTVLVAEAPAETYAEGAQMQLSAVRYGMASALPALWARQCAGDAGGEPGPWEPVGEGEQLTTTAQRGCQYVACLVDGATVVAISQALLPAVQ